MRKAETFICPLCQEVKSPEQKTRDHVLPEGFGAFDNTLTVPTCRDCNTGVGKKLEDRVFHGSYYSAIRTCLGIRSAKSVKNGSAFVDPIGKAKEAQKSGGEIEKFVALTATWNGRDVPVQRFRESGGTELPAMLQCEEVNGTPDVPIIIEGLEEDEICALALKELRESREQEKKLRLRILHNDEGMVRSILAKLVQMGFRQEDLAKENQDSSPTACRINGYVDEGHLRAHGFWLLKGMAKAGIKPSYLKYLADYVRTGVYDRDQCYSTWENLGDAKGYDLIKQHKFSHRIEWVVHPGYAEGRVLIFVQEKGGLAAKFEFNFPDNCPEILIPGPGAVIAAYHQDGKPGTGWIEMLQGSTILKTSRPKTDPEIKKLVKFRS